MDCLPPSHWREFIETRDAFTSVVSLPLKPRQLVAHGPEIREGLKERRRARTHQLARYSWQRIALSYRICRNTQGEARPGRHNKGVSPALPIKTKRSAAATE